MLFRTAFFFRFRFEQQLLMRPIISKPFLLQLYGTDKSHKRKSHFYMTCSKMFIKSVFFSKDKVVLEKVTKKLVLTGYTHVNFTVSVRRRTCFISFKGAVYFTEKMGRIFWSLFQSICTICGSS